MGKERDHEYSNNSQKKIDPFSGTFRAYSENANQYIAGIPPYFDRFTKRLATKSSIIELGCATGGISEYLRSMGHAVKATDVNPAMIARAKKLYPNLDVEILDMRNMNELQSYDGAVSAFSFIHISPEDAPLTMRKIRQSVKQGGSAYFVMQGIRYQELDEGWFQHPHETKPVYLYLYSPQYMNRLFTDSGFSDIETYSISAEEGEFPFLKDVYIVS